jgi:choline dehydrogenase-like flavoprotein
MLAHYYTRNMSVFSNCTSLPQASNNVSLDPQYSDRFGRPSLRITYADHPDDLAIARFMQERSIDILEAAGAKQTWRRAVEEETIGAHLLGTCRMGNDPLASVVDRWHRSHDVANLFICDGSSMVTSGRGQPTLTIQALAFRAADYIVKAARNNEIPSAL